MSLPETSGPNPDERLRANFSSVNARIEAACARAGRDPSDVALIWVSKTHPVESLQAARRAGARLFGENRVQEVLEKFPLPLEAGAPDYALHLIGSLQRNKARKAVPLCAAFHSVDTAELWETLNRISGELGVRRSVLLQVNTSREAAKSGIAPESLLDFMGALSDAPHLDLIGLMTMGPLEGGPEAARPGFRELAGLLREARARHGGRHPLLSKLSMGMSGDFEIAIEEGAHFVRVGTALFGSR
jgi:pyridoxal phosphate enzyme (YggS family)